MPSERHAAGDGTAERECAMCDGPGKWLQFSGMGAGPAAYCDDHTRDRLPREDKLPAYKDPITTAENVTTLRSGAAIIPGGGYIPVGERLPVIRSREAFDRYLDGDGVLDTTA